MRNGPCMLARIIAVNCVSSNLGCFNPERIARRPRGLALSLRPLSRQGQSDFLAADIKRAHGQNPPVELVYQFA